MSDSENPFVLLARITVKEGMVDAYLEITEEVDKAEEGMLFIALIVIPITSINLSGQKFIAKVTTFFFMQIIPLFKST